MAPTIARVILDVVVDTVVEGDDGGGGVEEVGAVDNGGGVGAVDNGGGVGAVENGEGVGAVENGGGRIVGDGTGEFVIPSCR